MSIPSSNESLIPPLGKPLEFDVEEKARSLEASQLPHATPDTDPLWASIWVDLTKFVCSYQQVYGIEPTAVDTSSVHIVDTENMDRVATLLGRQESIGGVYDPRLDVAYIKKSKYYKTELALIDLYYAIAHEIGHKLNPCLNSFYSLSDNAFILNEGLADRFARRFLHDVLIPTYTPAVVEQIRCKFASGESPYKFSDLIIKPSEVLFIDPHTEYARGFSRIAETRVVDMLEKKMGLVAFTELMRHAASSDILATREYVINQLGLASWELLCANSYTTPAL